MTGVRAGSQSAKTGSERLRAILRFVGPGVITGAADDDPSGIATYSQAGAQFGYAQLWTAAFMLPLQTAVQEACARIGAVNGQGIAAVVREHYSRPVLYAMVLLVLLANVINIGADIGAMAAAIQLLVPVPFPILMLVFTVVILALEIFSSYPSYAQLLKWLALSLLVYPAIVVIVREPWTTLVHATLIPRLELNYSFLFLITGVLGTTISPYMFFWEASEEVDEEREEHLIDRRGRPHLPRGFLRRLRIDNVLGMTLSEVGTWSIIVVAATVLHPQGVTDIRTAADAAKAIEPLVQSFPDAGLWAKVLFAFGIVSLGLLAVPVLSASAAYALSEAFEWRAGLALHLKDAHGFYGVITMATIAGLMINFVGVDPMRVLVVAAVINGVVAVPLLFVIARIAERSDIMGTARSGWVSRVLVWCTFAAMAFAAAAMLLTAAKYGAGT